MPRHNGSGGNRQVARYFASLLHYVEPGGIRTQITDSLRSESGAAVQAVFWDADYFNPSVGYIWGADFAVALIGGASNATLVNKLVAGYKSSILGPDQFPVNPALSLPAVTIANRITALGIGTKTYVKIAGYSMGGAIACHMLKNKAANAWMGAAPQVISIGAPRVGNNNDCHDMRAQGSIFRWFTQIDPVPYYPLHPEESLPFAIYSGRNNSIQYGRFLHPVPGMQVDAAFNVTPEMLPSAPSRLPIGDAVAWYIGAQGGTPLGHTLNEFTARIPLLITELQDFFPARPGPVEESQAHTRGDTNAAEIRTQGIVVTIDRQQNQFPTRIPKVRFCRARRFGRVWAVYFGDVLIVIRRSKRGTQTLARAMNLFLARLQNSALVSPDAILTELKGYLAAASDPTGGFVPVMNVALPVD